MSSFTTIGTALLYMSSVLMGVLSMPNVASVLAPAERGPYLTFQVARDQVPQLLPASGRSRKSRFRLWKVSPGWLRSLAAVAMQSFGSSPSRNVTGTANLFMMFAPLEGWRHVKVTDRHTAVDYARVLKDLADTHFANAKTIVLVQDNLSIHSKASLYEVFPARRSQAPGRALRMALHSKTRQL